MRMTPVDVLCTVECSCVLVVTDNPVVGWPLVAGLRNCVDGKLVTFLMKNSSQLLRGMSHFHTVLSSFISSMIPSTRSTTSSTISTAAWNCRFFTFFLVFGLMPWCTTVTVELLCCSVALPIISRPPTKPAGGASAACSTRFIARGAAVAMAKRPRKTRMNFMEFEWVKKKANRLRRVNRPGPAQLVKNWASIHPAFKEIWWSTERGVRVRVLVCQGVLIFCSARRNVRRKCHGV